MFLGEYKHNLDAKGRVSVPAKFRSDLGSSAIVTRGLDSCLFLYPKAEWEVMANKLASLPMTNPNARAFARMMLSGAMEVQIDNQGRALLPAYLREFAGIKNESVMAGVFNRVEIWEPTAWSQYSKNAEQNSDKNAEQLGEWGI